MIFSEVQRTLVKSPPELWAELSDPEALARHLGEFGEIHITRVQPEQKVEWEAATGEVSGTVAIKPSGWGTKVKLTVARGLELAEADPEPEDEPSEEPAVALADAAVDEAIDDEHLDGEPVDDEPAEQEPVALAQDLAGEREVEAEEEIEAEQAPEPPRDEPILEGEGPAQLAPDPVPASEPEPEPRRGFFARLFRRRRPAPQVATERPEIEEPEASWLDREVEAGHEVGEPEEPQTGEDGAEIEASVEEDDALGEGEDGAQPESSEELEEPAGEADPSPDVAAELEAAEELATEQATAVLTGVLDRLGAAHHRPFSRA